MRKILAATATLLLLVALTLPALAQNTEVEIIQGAGDPPIIKCKWETPDDADPTHSTPGTQTMPSGQYQVSKFVTVYTVITDPQGIETVLPPPPEGAVYVNIWHPLGPPENGSEKYHQLPMQPVDKQTVGLPMFDQAVAEDLIMAFGTDPVTGNPYTIDEIREELVQCLAEVYAVQVEMHYHQPWGLYGVEVEARDNTNQWAIPLSNEFLYEQLTKVEVDFDLVDYGRVEVCTNKWIGGNSVWDDGIPTVRNIGNTNLKVTVEQDDMGLGKSGTDWNVCYDARIGVGDPEVPGADITYYPDELVTIPDVLMLCNTHKIDFSIHVIKGMAGTYRGTMTIGSEFAPF
jgi:hypothetical protein